MEERGAHEVGVYDDKRLSRSAFGCVSSCRDYPCQSFADDVLCHLTLTSIGCGACFSIDVGGLVP